MEDNEITITPQGNGYWINVPTDNGGHGMPITKEHHEQLREYFRALEVATKLEIGTILVARQDLRMKTSKEIALIKGGEYVIKDITGLCFSIESLIDKSHFFDIEDYEQYFYIKP